MSIDLEPHPPEDGEIWEEGSPQWLTRYEYIEARSERYLESYHDSVDYDFTRTVGMVKYQKLSVQSGYEKYAAGTMTLLGVKSLVGMLRDCYKRKEVKPVSPEEKAKQAEKPEYVPQWRKDWQSKKDEERGAQTRRMLLEQPSPDRTAFLTGRAYSDKTSGVTPMPGLNCYSVSEDEGYLADGSRVSKGQAYLAVLWDCQDYYYPDKRDKRPANLTGLPEPETSPEKIETKTLDELKRETELQAQGAALDKRLKRGKRAIAGSKS